MRFLLIILALCSLTVKAEIVSITLPMDNTKLKPSTLPGYGLAQAKCHLCHSVDYVMYQPPEMDLKEWTGEMYKMRNAYGAPISMGEAKVIAAYLSVAYGSAKETDAEIMALTKLASTKKIYQPDNLDVKSLLSDNDCLTCHKDSGVSSIKDIRAKYEGTDNAVDRLGVAIKSGGLGMPKPPINRHESEAIAKYILGESAK
ncbi:MAG: cytochrome c551/c552 [Moritella dasanensis]|jgi:cytochrome c551/c552